MTEKKITKKDNFKAIIEILKDYERDDLVGVMEHELELLEKKNAYKSTNKRKIAENTELVEEIKSVFLDNLTQMFNCSDVVRYLNFKYSTQKLAPQLNKMVENGILKVTMDKKVKFYSLAD